MKNELSSAAREKLPIRCSSQLQMHSTTECNANYLYMLMLIAYIIACVSHTKKGQQQNKKKGNKNNAKQKRYRNGPTAVQCKNCTHIINLKLLVK